METRRIVLSPFQFDRLQRGVHEAEMRGATTLEAAFWGLLCAEHGLTIDDRLPLRIDVVVDWQSQAGK